MGRIRSAVRPACRVCAGIEILCVEENAAMAASRRDGIDLEGNGHGITIQIVCSKCHACWSFSRIQVGGAGSIDRTESKGYQSRINTILRREMSASLDLTNGKQGRARMERECDLYGLDDRWSLFVVPLKQRRKPGGLKSLRGELSL
jgi:hypothetical protein